MSYMLGAFSHVFMIGTNRNLGECVECYVPEVRYLEEALHEKVPLVVVEDGRECTERENRKLIEGSYSGTCGS